MVEQEVQAGRGAAEGAGAEDGRSRRARRKRRARRQQVLEAARQVFAEKGYQAASVTDVIEAAGISRGTFYTYFKTKHAVFDEILVDLFSRLQGCLERIEVTPGAIDVDDVLQQLRGNVVRILEVLAQNRDHCQILRRTAMGIDPEFDAKLGEFYGALTDLLERTLREGIEIGLLRPLDTRVVAHCILGSAKEITARLHAEPESTLPDLDDLVNELVSYNLRGLMR